MTKELRKYEPPDISIEMTVEFETGISGLPPLMNEEQGGTNSGSSPGVSGIFLEILKRL